MIQVKYNGVSLGPIGELTVTGPSRTYDPPEAPQRIGHTLRVVVDIFPTAYLTGHNNVQTIITALKAQHGDLQWGEAGPPVVDFVNRRVSVREAELPEDPNGWGTYHRRLVLVFAWVENLSATDARNIGTDGVATFLKTGGDPEADRIDLGNIISWQESLRHNWLHERRSARERSEGRVMVSGFIGVDTSGDLDACRAALLPARKRLWDAMNSKEGTLKRLAPGVEALPPGSFSQVVRIDDLTLTVDQAHSQIAYSFTARYTAWPDDAEYSTERFTLSQQSRREDGQVTAAFRGTIQANNYDAAIARLTTLRTAVMQKTFGISSVVRRVVSSDLNAAYVSGGDDAIATLADVADAFIELNFDETWLVFGSELTRPWSLRYAIRRRRDLLGGREMTEVNGELFGPSDKLKKVAEYEAGNFLDEFYEARGWLEKLTQDDRELTYEASSEWTSGAMLLPALGNNEVHREQRVSFSASWQEAMDPSEAILECDVTESVTHSGTRWVEHRRPDGVSSFQDCGIESARREVSGSVRATQRATCEAFVHGKRKLLECRRGDGVNASAREDPPSVNVRYEWLQRPAAGVVDKVREASTADSDVVIFTMDFRFQERLPELELVAPVT